MSNTNTELVAYSDARRQQEALDGTPNLYHDSLLAPAHAERINSSINIVGYAAEHGRPGSFPPNQRQFEEIAGLVNSLKPERGDKLFVENAGHNGTPLTEEDIAGFRRNPQIIMGILEQKRRDGSINTFAYGAILAALKGIPVFSADMDKVHQEALEKVTGEAMVKMDSPFSSHRDDAARLREKQSANVVKDQALAALPHISGDKPTYAVLFGMGHFSEKEASSIPAAFKDLGLEMKTIELSKVARAKRAYQAGKLLVRAAALRKSPFRVVQDDLKY
jgi:hypothetical protein